MAWIEPLDLQNMIVNTMAGNWDIYIAIMLCSIAGLAAYFRVSNEIALILLAFFFIIMSPYIGSAYMLFAIIIGSILVYFAIGKLVKN